MLKTRALLLLISTIVVIVLFNLPMSVVENDPTIGEEGQNSENTIKKEGPGQSGLDPSHSFQLSENDKKTVARLKESYKTSINKEKSAIFADSLAQLFRNINKLDSAAKYIELVAIDIPNEENWQKAGDSYYEAFEFAIDPQKAALLGEKSRTYYNKVLKLTPGRLDLKTKVAMTHVSSDNPMQGVMMLREVLEEDPDYAEAIFNMGLLAIRSGQYERAVGRFERLVQLQPDNYEAYFYLGVSFKELGNKNESQAQFEKVKLLTDKPEIHESVNRYLEELE